MRNAVIALEETLNSMLSGILTLQLSLLRCFSIIVDIVDDKVIEAPNIVGDIHWPGGQRLWYALDEANEGDSNL